MNNTGNIENTGNTGNMGGNKGINQIINKFDNIVAWPWTIRLILYILVIFIVMTVIIIIYLLYLLYISHPRPRTIGHSEPLNDYMKQHTYLVVKHIRILYYYLQSNEEGKKNKKLKKIIDGLVENGVIPLTDNKEKTDEELEDYVPRELPYLYLFYMFKRALTGKTTNFKKMELHLIKRLSGLETLLIDGKEENIYNDSETEVRDEIIEHIKKKTENLWTLQDYLGKNYCEFRGQKYNEKTKKCNKSYKWTQQKNVFPRKLNDIITEISREHLTLLHYTYSPNIEKMYDLRKSGGIGNFVIYTIYMGQYVEFIFFEKIPSIWENFIPRVKTTGGLYWNAVTAEPVAKYMAKLPLTLSGIEGFTPKKEDKDGFKFNTIYDILHKDAEGNVIEHFGGGGFGNIIKSLVMLLPNLLKVIMAIVQVITNPLKIIQLVLGLLIGIVIYVLYLLISILGPLFYIPAFCWLLAFSLLMTIIWVALFVALAIIYFVLWIFDWATNGLVFSMLRCENLPTVWHEGANYIYNNIFDRFLMCNKPCQNNYIPDGFFCKKTYKHQPLYCPQQLIMNIYNQRTLNIKGKHPSIEKNPFFDYKADVEYIQSPTDKKKDLLDEFYERQKKFSKKCDEELATYNFITLHICQNLDHIATHYGIEGEEYDKLKTACYKCYCKYFYVKSNGKMIQKPFLKLLILEEKIDSPFLYLLKDEEINILKKDLNNDMEKADNENIKKGLASSLETIKDNQEKQEKSTLYFYIAFDGFNTDKNVKSIKDVSHKIYNIPNVTEHLSFCKDIIEEISPEIAIEKRKKGVIFFYVLYACLVLIMVYFAFIILYDGTKSKFGT